MNEFLNVAKSLEIKEISKDIEIPDNEKVDNVKNQNFDRTNELPAPKNEIVPEKILKTNFRQRQTMGSNFDKKYSCEQCSYKTSQSSHLNQHIKSVHEGVKYPCDQCNHKASQLSHLNRHIRSVHEGVKYPCEKCNYEAKLLHHLHSHIKLKHF